MLVGVDFKVIIDKEQNLLVGTMLCRTPVKWESPVWARRPTWSSCCPHPGSQVQTVYVDGVSYRANQIQLGTNSLDSGFKGTYSDTGSQVELGCIRYLQGETVNRGQKWLFSM